VLPIRLRKSAVPLGLSLLALAVSITNAVVLWQVVGAEQSRLALAWGLVLALGPLGVVIGVLLRRRVVAVVAVVLFTAASFITGFSVGFWNLVIAVPLSIAAVIGFSIGQPKRPRGVEAERTSATEPPSL
jgi:hypothetical protein